MANTIEKQDLDVLGVEVTIPIQDVSLDTGANIHTEADQQTLHLPGVGDYLDALKEYMPTEIIPYDIDGVSTNIEVWQLPLYDPRFPSDKSRLEFLRNLAFFSPIVFAKQGPGSEPVMGMLSPFFDSTGSKPEPGLKVLTLKRPIELKTTGSDLVPDAYTATMLAGSANGESQGIGSHEGPLAQDIDHVMTVIGAISLGSTTILGTDGRHIQHAFRPTDSIDNLLTNGTLGNVFADDASSGELFTGFGMPLIFDPDRLTAHDVIYIPKALASSKEGYGLGYPDAHGTRLEKAVRTVHNDIGKAKTSSRIAALLESAR